MIIISFMNEYQKRRREFLNEAIKFEKSKKTRHYKLFKKYLYSPLWAFIISKMLRYIDFKKYDKVVKLDLWDEAVTFHPDVRKTIIKMLKPKKLYYIEWVKEFCFNFSKKKGNFEHIINGNVIEWPFKDNSLDVIIDLSTLDHLKKEEIKKTLKEFYRSLKKGGFLVFVYANKEYINVKEFFKFEFYTNPLYPNEIKKIIKEIPFKIIYEDFSFPVIFDSKFSPLSVYFMAFLSWLFLYRVKLLSLFFYAIDKFFNKYEKINVFSCFLLTK